MHTKHVFKAANNNRRYSIKYYYICKLSFTFSITAGNEDGRFAICVNTGIISTTTTLNAQEDFYNLTVEAYLTSNDIVNEEELMLKLL